MKSKAPSTNLDLLRYAWRLSGGWQGNLKSLEFRVAALVWLISAHSWIRPLWWEVVLDVLPTVLGFTLSGFAIFLGFGSEKFKRFLSMDKKPDESLYMSVSAAFIVFVGFQTLALLFALSAKGLYFPTPQALIPFLLIIKYGSYVCGAVGYFLFIYSISLSLRAALRIFRIARWYNIYLNIPRGKQNLRQRRKRRAAARSKD